MDSLGIILSDMFTNTKIEVVLEFWIGQFLRME